MITGKSRCEGKRRCPCGLRTPHLQHLHILRWLVVQPGSRGASCACLETCISSLACLRWCKDTQQSWLVRYDIHPCFLRAWLKRGRGAASQDALSGEPIAPLATARYLAPCCDLRGRPADLFLAAALLSYPFPVVPSCREAAWLATRLGHICRHGGGQRLGDAESGSDLVRTGSRSGERSSKLKQRVSISRSQLYCKKWLHVYVHVERAEHWPRASWMCEQWCYELESAIISDCLNYHSGRTVGVYI
jgi:hypothetical protein